MAPSRYHRSHTSTSPRIRLACLDVSQTCSFPFVAHIPAVGQKPYHTTTSATFMCAPPPVKPIQAVISRLVPQATVQQVQAMPSVHCQRAYGVKVSNGTSLVLVIPPSPMVKLLRSERASVISEAAVLKWLADTAFEQPLLQERTPEPEESLYLEPVSALARGGGGLGSSVDDGVNKLLPMVPTLISHMAASNELGLEYNLLEPTNGTPISELDPPLTPPERRTIDFQIGQFYRQLCKLVSPTGRFGPAFAVLPSAAPHTVADPTKPAQRDVNARLLESKGVQSWATAFHSMLEAVLRDGEDMQVMLGYGAIRRHFKRFQHTLDGVKTPRLVAVDAGKDVNVLARRKSHRTGATSAPSRRNDGPVDIPQTSSNVVSEDEGKDMTESESGDDETAAVHHRDGIMVAGMKDWSNFVFGDPLFAITFGRDPSSEFLAGFNGGSDTQSAIAEVFSSDTIEDKERAHVRLLLYDCYHTVTYIARGFFRPQKDSAGLELEARKRLNHILTQLDALDDAGSLRGRRPSGELSPAKRSKSGVKDD